MAGYAVIRVARFFFALSVCYTFVEHEPNF